MGKLHILNGDATAEIFKQTAIDGDILVWREILGEGPVSEDRLFELRAHWMAFAEEAWRLYVENDPDAISAFLSRNFGNLELLKPALLAHLSRFPDPLTGLNHIEKTLLSIVSNSALQSAQIYEAFWAKEPIYGITDLQLDVELAKLKTKGLI